MSGASDKAVESARTTLKRTNREHLRGWWEEAAQYALGAAHNPALGLDRSVCLRDVVEALRRQGAVTPMAVGDPLPTADSIEREFGGVE